VLNQPRRNRKRLKIEPVCPVTGAQSIRSFHYRFSALNSAALDPLRSGNKLVAGAFPPDGTTLQRAAGGAGDAAGMQCLHFHNMKNLLSVSQYLSGCLPPFPYARAPMPLRRVCGRCERFKAFVGESFAPALPSDPPTPLFSC
jgi:hypothetical protein